MLSCDANNEREKEKSCFHLTTGKDSFCLFLRGEWCCPQRHCPFLGDRAYRVQQPSFVLLPACFVNGNEKKPLLSSLRGPWECCWFECRTLAGPRASVQLHSRISGQRAAGYWCEREERKGAVALKLLGLFKKQTNATSRERWISPFLKETTSACLASLFVLPFGCVFHVKPCCSLSLSPSGSTVPALWAAGWILGP